MVAPTERPFQDPDMRLQGRRCGCHKSLVRSMTTRSPQPEEVGPTEQPLEMCKKEAGGGGGTEGELRSRARTRRSEPRGGFIELTSDSSAPAMKKSRAGARHRRRAPDKAPYIRQDTTSSVLRARS